MRWRRSWAAAANRAAVRCWLRRRSSSQGLFLTSEIWPLILCRSVRGASAGRLQEIPDLSDEPDPAAPFAVGPLAQEMDLAREVLRQAEFALEVPFGRGLGQPVSNRYRQLPADPDQSFGVGADIGQSEGSQI